MVVDKAEFILGEVCKMLKLRHAELLGPRKSQRVAFGRMVVSIALRRLTGMTYTDIGRFLRRDHSTIVHHCLRNPNRPQVVEMLRRIEIALNDALAKSAPSCGPMYGVEMYGETAF